MTTIARTILPIAVALTICGLSLSHAQSSFYPVRADARQADKHVSAHADSLVSGTETPFWSAVEPLIGAYDLCTELQGVEVAAKDRLNFTQEYADLGVLGSGIALDWMIENGLEPLQGTDLAVADPRAPSGYPIFCSLFPVSEVTDFRSRLRPVFFDFVTDPTHRHAYVRANVDIMFDGIEKSLSYNWRSRILLGASWNIANLWDFSRQVSKQKGPAPAFLVAAALDAIAVTSLEESGEFLYGDYADIEQRFPFLQGNFSKRLTDWQGGYSFLISGGEASPPPDSMATTAMSASPAPLSEDQQEEETKGALLKFLIEEQLDDDWSQLGRMMDAATGQDNPMSAIDLFLDENDGDLYRGLQHAFPAFVAHQASLVFDKYRGKINPAVWLADSFGGCPDVVIDEVSVSQTRTVEILPYAARCFIVRYEARHAGWTGDAQVRAQIANGQPGDDRVGDVFFSFAAMGYHNPIDPYVTCATMDTVQKCLAIPTTPPSRNKDGVLQTYYNTPLEREATEKKWTIMLISYVPTDARPGGAASRPGVNLEVTWSLDAVIGDPGDLADMGASSGEFELMDMSTAVIDHGSKVGKAPILAKRPGGIDVSWRSIFDGSASPIDGSILDSATSAFDNVIQFIDENGDGFGVILDPVDLALGKTGRAKPIAVFASKDGYLSIPDPDFDGSVEIIENTKDTLYFTAEEGFCMLPMSEWPRLLARENPDLCEDGERVEAKAKGAIAFPPTRRSETRLEPTESETYEGLQAIRQAMIAERFGGVMTKTNMPGGPVGPASPPSAPGNDPVEAVGVGSGSVSACAVRSEAGGCDCSCEAKACFEAKQSRQTIIPSEASCRLTCGKKWKACTP